MQLIQPEIQAYSQKYTSADSKEAQSIIQNSENQLEHIEMLSGKVVGQLLAMLIKISGAKNVLEIGTFTGYSALRMAEALPVDGQLMTCEYNERYGDMAQSAFGKSGHGHKITLKMGPALQTIETLSESFGLIFLDADKVNYPNYYNVLLPKLKTGGLLIVDNVLWSGAVLAPADDDKAEAIDRLNKIAAEDSRAEQVMLTVRDGMMIVRKRSRSHRLSGSLKNHHTAPNDISDI